MYGQIWNVSGAAQVRKFASSQVRNPSKKSYPTLDAASHTKLAAQHVGWFPHTAHCTPHANSSEGSREAGLPSEHLRSVGNIALIACARGLPGRKSRQTKAAEAWMLHANPMSMRVHLQSTDRAASACHGARQTL
jgi:hypothetical protein